MTKYFISFLAIILILVGFYNYIDKQNPQAKEEDKSYIRKSSEESEKSNSDKYYDMVGRPCEDEEGVVIPCKG